MTDASVMQAGRDRPLRLVRTQGRDRRDNHPVLHDPGTGFDDVAGGGQASARAVVQVDLPRPHAQVLASGRLEGHGWIIANADIADVTVSVAGAVICRARTGLPREDVAAAYPAHLGSWQAGFAFDGVMPSDACGPTAIVIHVRFADGGTAEHAVPIDVEMPAPPPPAEPLDSIEPVVLHLEQAKVDRRGILALHGWAASLGPVESVEVTAGDRRLGLAEMDLPRPDVQARHSEYANAATSGFLFRGAVADEVLALGSVQVLVRTIGGITRQAAIPLDVPPVIWRRLQKDGAIHFHCDRVSLLENGRIDVAGWAAAAQGIAAIDVLVDGDRVGTAALGQPRPDVGNAHPTIPDARNAGFSFEQVLETHIAGEHLVELVVRTSTGETFDVPLPVRAVAGAAPAAALAEGIANDAFRFSLDSPVVRDGKAVHPLRGMLSIGGWALARQGLARIEVFLGRQTLGAAYIGMRREDVLASYADWPGALLSGFGLVVPHRSMTIGQHTIRIVGYDMAGNTFETCFEVTVEASADESGPDFLRKRVFQAEIDLKTGLIAATGAKPVFAAVMRLSSDTEAELRRARTTVQTLRHQAGAEWHLTLLLPPRFDRSRAAQISEGCESRVSWFDHGTIARDTWPIARLLGVADARGGRAYLLPLQPGDQLGADAILEFAVQAAMRPDASVIYADERRYDPARAAVEAFHKPDWSPDLLLSTNYIGRPWCADMALVRAAGVSAHDLIQHGEYDLILRLTEKAEAIIHVPMLLGQRGRRTIDTASQERRALRRALQRRAVRGDVLSGCASGVYRVRRAVAEGGLVSIIIPTMAAGGLISKAIASIRSLTRYRGFEIVCIDNIPARDKAWKRWLRTHADRVVTITEAFNWSRFNNAGAAAARGDYLLFLNDDIEVVDPGWLDALLEHAQRDDVGAVGPRLLYPDRKVQHAGLFLTATGSRHAFRFAPEDEPGPFGLALTQRNVIGVTGACLLVARKTFDALGGFDESHSVTNNDLDFCLRLGAAGKPVVFTPHATLIHHELASRSSLKDIYDADGFRTRWGSRMLLGDPYFHPTLSTDHDTYAADHEPPRMVCAGYPILARADVRRILVLKLDHIGDFITGLPAIRRIKERFPRAELHALVPAGSVVLARLEPAIDAVIEFNFFSAVSGEGRRRLTRRDREALARQLAPHAFDIAIDFRKHSDTREILQLTGARLLAGFDHRGQHPYLDIALEWEGDTPSSGKRSHVADDFVQLAEAVSSACESGRALMAGVMRRDEAAALVRAIPSVAEVALALFARRVVCVHPASGNVMRQWPAVHFAGLIDLLTENAGVHVVLIGTRADAPLADAVTAALRFPHRAWSFVGKTGMKDLPTLLQACDLYVGNNSGPKHIAAALGVPTVGVHSGVVDAREWAPLGPRAVAVQREMTCSPCYLADPAACTRGLACLHGLRPADVFRICEQMLRFGRDGTAAANADDVVPTTLETDHAGHAAVAAHRPWKSNRKPGRRAQAVAIGDGP